MGYFKFIKYEDGAWYIFNTKKRGSKVNGAWDFSDTKKEAERKATANEDGAGVLIYTRDDVPARFHPFVDNIENYLQRNGVVEKEEAYTVRPTGSEGWGVYVAKGWESPGRASATASTKVATVTESKRLMKSTDRIGVLVTDTRGVPNRFIPNLEMFDSKAQEFLDRIQ
jgi:hypothetical protein